MKSDASSQSDKPETPFERFQELARKLIAVPKDEIDHEIEAEKVKPKKPRRRRYSRTH